MDNKRRRWWRNPLEVDEHDLEFELWRQPKLVKRWHVRAANARKDVNEAKSRLELVEAELRLAITRRPAKFGLKSATIPIVEAAVIAHPKYQKADARHIAAKYALDVVLGMVEALKDKKLALEKDSDFYLAGFFAVPKSRGAADFGKRRARHSASRALE